MSLKLRVAGMFTVLVVGVFLLTAVLIWRDRDARLLSWRPQAVSDCRAPMVAVARHPNGWACGYTRTGTGAGSQSQQFYYLRDSP
jgi:hypothetical protein